MSMLKCNSQNQEGGGGNESNVKDNLLAKHKFGRHPYPSLPTKLVVAIDGWAHSGKNTTGELVAEAIQGVLVDSGRFYRAFTRACIDRGINLDAEDKVAEFCWNSSLDCRLLHEGGRVMELQVAIGGRWFTKEDLNWVANDTSKVARVFEVRQIVNRSLRASSLFGRVVMLGRDIGSAVFPETPFKFFLDAPAEIREWRHLQRSGVSGVTQRDLNDHNNTVRAKDAFTVETGRLMPDEVRGIILVEILSRNGDLGDRGKKL